MSSEKSELIRLDGNREIGLVEHHRIFERMRLEACRHQPCRCNARAVGSQTPALKRSMSDCLCQSQRALESVGGGERSAIAAVPLSVP